jgi:hypothetical protein
MSVVVRPVADGAAMARPREPGGERCNCRAGSGPKRASERDGRGEAGEAACVETQPPVAVRPDVEDGAAPACRTRDRTRRAARCNSTARTPDANDEGFESGQADGTPERGRRSRALAGSGAA